MISSTGVHRRPAHEIRGAVDSTGLGTTGRHVSGIPPCFGALLASAPGCPGVAPHPAPGYFGATAARQLLMRAGTIVDTIVIAAPSSTKNAGNTRDPEIHQTKKGNAWHFGMKARVRNDVRLVTTVMSCQWISRKKSGDFHGR